MKNALLIAIALAGTTACTHLSAPLSVYEDKATAQNFSAQVVNPNAVAGAPLPDPVLTAAAIARYHSDDVKTGESEGQPIIQLNLGPAQ